MMKVRELAFYNYFQGKWDLTKIKRNYLYNNSYLLKMKDDLYFLNNSILNNYIELNELPTDQTKDFLFSFPSNGIINPELDNYFNLSKIPEDKSFSDLYFFSLGNKPHNLSYELKDDLSNNSFDNFQSSKKSELEFEF